MAIQMAIENSNFGVTFEKGYLKIGEVLIKPLKDEVRVDLRGYASIEARELVKTFEVLREEYDELRRDPESDDSRIKELENKLGKKPIGIYKERLELKLSDIEDFCEGFSKSDIITGCYLYLKTLDQYKDSLDK